MNTVPHYCDNFPKQVIPGFYLVMDACPKCGNSTILQVNEPLFHEHCIDIHACKYTCNGRSSLQGIAWRDRTAEINVCKYGKESVTDDRNAAFDL